MNRFLACLVALSLVVAADASFARSSKKPEEAAAEAKKETGTSKTRGLYEMVGDAGLEPTTSTL
mgnify:CR=1 FL=1